jgi:bifunctional UDP-N-acetylglucosamine pyrophosphorylase/glucosamine-1-phosphate N-acetyltransferase
MVLNVVIMAAGKGTRMRSARPKVLHRLAGRHLLQHVLDAAAGLGASRTIVVTGHGAAEVERATGAPGLAFVRQEPQLGTGHALQQAAPLLDDTGTTLVLNGDVPLIEVETLQALIAASGGDKLALLTVALADPKGYGRVLRSGGAITAIVEEKDASAAEREIAEIYTGVMAAPTAALKRWLGGLKNDNAAGEYYLTDVVGLAVAAERRSSASRRGRDRGARRQQRGAARRPRAALPAARRRAPDERGRAPRRSGALRPARHAALRQRRRDRRRLHLRRRGRARRRRAHRRALVRPQRPHRRRRDDPALHPHRRRGARRERRRGRDRRPVRAPARRRALGAEVHIGNFVEVKNSTLGRGAKANHLAYLGDADVGERVNYGAGAITANYDGANKHRTTSAPMRTSAATSSWWRR